MGVLTIESGAIVKPIFSYDNFSSTSDRFTCNTGKSTNIVSFNSSGGYRTGFNYTGPNNITLRLLSYSDIMIERVPGVLDILIGSTPSTLQDASNNNITYPYDIVLPSISVGSVGVFQSAAFPELECPTTPGNIVDRLRTITYEVEDSLGNIGPVRTAENNLRYIP